jgi:hypothetical protein
MSDLPELKVLLQWIPGSLLEICSPRGQSTVTAADAASAEAWLAAYRTAHSLVVYGMRTVVVFSGLLWLM